MGKFKNIYFFISRKINYSFRIIESISKHHPENEENLEEFVSNPIRAFSLLKRLVITWPEIRDNLEENTARDNFIQISAIHKTFKLTYPEYTDYSGACEALARVQDTYKLNIEEFTEGIINGRKSSQPLSWMDCFHIGHTLYKSELYKLALLWIKESERKLLLSNEVNNNSLAALYDNIAGNNIKLGRFEDAIDAVEKMEELDPNFPKLEERQNEVINSLGTAAPKTYKDSIEYDLYQKVCRDEIKPTPEHQRNLRCRYKTGPEPFLTLAAYKMEELSLNPFVAVFYDAIYDKEIEYIKNYAQPHIQISNVVGHQGLVSHRISKTTWMPYENFDVLKGIEQRITYLTDLSMVNAEHLQVVNYGIGGHYEPHTDGFKDTTAVNDHGNRVATALFYVS